MPITSSAKKALRQSARRKAKNLSKERAYKSAVKEYRRLLGAKNIEGARAGLSSVYQLLDKAAKAGAIKKNTANRLKSRLARRLKG